MFKKLFLMLALVSSAGLIAAEGEDDASVIFTDEIEQPGKVTGKVKRAVNFLTKNWMVTAPVAVVLAWLSHAGFRKATYATSFRKALLADVKFFTKDWKDGYKLDWKVLTCPTDAKVAKLKANVDAVFGAVCKTHVDALAAELAKSAAENPDVDGVRNALTAEFDKLTFNAAKELIVTDSADKTVVAENTAAGIAALKAKLTEFEAKSAKHAEAFAKNRVRNQAIADFNA